MKQILPGIHQLTLGPVAAYLVAHGSTLTLIDTGNPGSEKKILDYLARIGRKPEDIKTIILTHLHTDHAGSAAALKSATGAAVVAHPVDAEPLKTGISQRPATHAAKGFANFIIYQLFIRRAPKTVESVMADTLVEDGDTIAAGDGFKVIHTPGHSAGHISLLYGDVLFVADACAHNSGLRLAPANEDESLAVKGRQALAALDFKAAMFGHGKPILTGASQKFGEKWGSQ